MARRVVLSGCCLLVLASAGLGDKLILTDGRTFTGTVAVEGDAVLITVPYGTLRFSKAQVERIELKDTPEQEFRKKLGEVPLDDPNALYALADWADRNALKRQASDLYALILKLDPNHAPTRRAKGFVRIQKRWLTFAQAIELTRSKLEAGSYAPVIHEILPVLETAARSRDGQLEVMELAAHAYLRSRQFEVARQKFSELAFQATDPNAARYSAIAQILESNPDGMYLLREPYPPASTLLGGLAETIRPGPASLARPLVLEAALRDLAKKQIAAGQELMAEASKLEPTDPDAASRKYALAAQAFDRADALVPRIAHSYRVEIARRKIASLRRDVKADAEKFDEQMARLGTEDLSPQAFRTLILRMVHHLDNTREDLHRLLGTARGFPRELVLEIRWAEMDLARIEKMRTILVTKLDGRD